jgi:hypothetical protein
MRSALFAVILCCLAAKASALDTLFFKNDFERSQFKSGPQIKKDVLGLLIAIDSDSNAFDFVNQKLNNFYRQIELKGIHQKPPKAFSKLLFKEVHDSFFSQYIESATFSEIFYKRIYNCVSACALYATILDHYQVPYVIKELPTHVYLVAYPQTHNVMFETTNPRGLFIPDAKAQENYVNSLIQSKFTTQEYVTLIGHKKAFEEFYYSKENITLMMIAGIQYRNESLSLMEAKKTEQAIHSIMKACVLYPSEKNDLFKIGLIGSYLDGSNYDKALDIVYLIELANTLRDNSLKKDIVNSFKRIIYNTLHEHSNDSALVKTYNVLRGSVKDSVLTRELDYNYNLAFAEWFGSKGKFEKCLEYARVAYRINPTNSRLQEIISQSILQKSGLTFGKIDDLKLLAGYETEFPFLKTNNYFRTLYAINYTYLSYKFFSDNQPDDGYKYLHLLEAEVKQSKKELLIKEAQIALAFAEAGAYHFRQKEFLKAKEIINKGFEYAPDDYELRERLKIVDEEMAKKKR